ncbi:MAG: class I SAM-dependent methyltransferase [Alphaproteobacteria bacterium]|nr:class I SAM-dependent methyltransferase [Alphaproteobacteria bacterium]
MVDQQQIQDEEYLFPYHYVAQFGAAGFKSHFCDDWAINYASTMEYMLKQVSACDARSIVDIGCGDGRFTRELALAFSNRRIVGIDYSERAIRLARAMNQDQEISFQAVDITTPSKIERFDAAILMEVFEHIPLPETKNFIEGVHNLLVAGGRLFLTVPHVNKPVEYKHFQHFSVESITKHLSDMFVVEKIVPFEKISMSRKLLAKIISNRIFVLNNRYTLNFLYKYYTNSLFNCRNEQQCQRIYVEAVARP